ncbi:MAG: PQQ-binding-like beta-propeller repeat protein [Solirubrobacteraceae bacterium]
MSSPSPRRKLRWVLVAVAILALAAGGAAAFVLLHAPGNVSNDKVPFTTSTASSGQPTSTFLWARYGYDAGRTRFFPGPPGLRPPFRVGWKRQDYAELEFPPVIYGNRLYDLDDDGSVKAIDKLTGRKVWERKVGTLSAASPTLDLKQGLLFVPVLSIHGHSPGHGRFVALRMKTGKIAWSRPLAAGSESSPTALGGSVYFGDQAGNVFDLRTRDGHLNWMFKASGAVKGGPALVGGRLFFGDYAGRAYALNAATGHQIWVENTSGTNFGFGSGNFYATPAVAFGRVYMGNTDGRMYSFAQRTGQLGWATATGSYVYASAAVDNVRGLGPTVYAGSYDGNLYAFNARTGSIRWRHNAGGKISGSATLVGGILYYQDLGRKTTEGLYARNGRRIFSFPDGAFNGVISDNRALYLCGSTILYELLPKRAAAHGGGATHHRDPKASAGRRRR